MDRQHEPIRHHSFEAGITASISKTSPTVQTWKIKRTLWIAAASPFVCIHVRIFSKRIETFSSFSVWECLTKQDEGECGITWRVFLLLVCIRLYRCRLINLINLYRILLGNFHHQDLFSLNLDLVYGGIIIWASHSQHHTTPHNISKHRKTPQEPRKNHITFHNVAQHLRTSQNTRPQCCITSGI